MANPTDHLATVRAALAHAGKATPGPWSAEMDIFDSDDGIVATISNVGTTMLATIGTDHVTTHAEWEADPIAAKEKADGQWRHRDEQEMRDAAAIVALRNAAPAIAALADECERLADLFDRIDTAFDQLRPAMADPFVAFVCATMHAAKDPAAPAPALLSDVPMGGDA